MNYYFYFYIAPHAPGTFYCATAAVPPARRRRGVADVGGGRDEPAGHRRGCGCARVPSDAEPFKSYGDPDVNNPIPPFTPS